MDVSGVLKYASEKGLALDGFDVQEMFPAKTNWHELEGAVDSPSPTWMLLKLQIRRMVLSWVHKILFYYATAPHISFSPFGKGARLALGGTASPMHYPQRKCSTTELKDFTVGPKCVAVALSFSPPQQPVVRESLEIKQLADGTVWTPTSEQYDSHRRSQVKALENYWSGVEAAHKILFDQTAELTEWAVLTPCIDTLIIFESSGQFALRPKEVFEAVQTKQSLVTPSLQRDVTCGFPDSPPESSELRIIWADKTRLPTESIDMFVAFDGTTNGYPLEGLSNCEIFSPIRRQLLVDEGPQLLDFIQALKFYRDIKASGPVDPAD